MIRKIGRKGEDTLMKNVLSVVIFVLSFALIAYGVYKVYTVFLNQDTKNAQNTLDKITAKINSLENGESTSATIQGFKDSRMWGLVSWNRDSPVSEKPDKCYFKSCICLCKDTSKLWTTYNEEVNSCKKSNMCSVFDYETIDILDDEGQKKDWAGVNRYVFPTNLDELKISTSSDGAGLKIEYKRVNQP